MSLKLFLDDIRDPPDDTWILCRDVPTFIHLARHADVLSLDHDLGDGVPTGYDVLLTLEKEVAMQGLWADKVPVIQVHSANPVGISNMIACIKSIRKILDICIQDTCWNKALVSGSFCSDCTYKEN